METDNQDRKYLDQSTPAPATTATQVTPISQVTSPPQTTQTPTEIVKRFKIAFISYRDKKPALFIMNEDGSNQTRIVKEPVIDVPPQWSPDGTRIMYLKNNGKQTELWTIQVYSIRTGRCI